MMFLLVLVPLVAGCAKVDPPSVTVRGIELGEVDADGIEFKLDLGLRNPNDFDLGLAKSDYKLSLAGQRLLTGRVNPKTNLPALGEADVVFPVVVRWDDLLDLTDLFERGGSADGDLPFTFDARLGVKPPGPAGWFGGRSIPVTYTGKLPVRSAVDDPRLLLRSPAVRKMLEILLRSSSR
jgi:hypothetical protein